jgi:hypothetical protein
VPCTPRTVKSARSRHSPRPVSTRQLSRCCVRVSIVADSQLPIYVDSEPSRHSFPHMVVSAAIFSLRVVSSGLHVGRVVIGVSLCGLPRSAMEIFYLCSACLSRECSCVSHVLRPASFDDGDFLLCVVSSRLHARVPLGVLILCMVHAWPFGEPYSRLHAAFALCSFCLVLRVLIVERTLFFCCSCPLLRPIFLVFASPCSFYFYLPVTSTTYRGCFPFVCSSLSGSSTVISDASLLYVRLISFPRSLPILLHDARVHVTFVQVLLVSPSKPQPSQVLQVSCSFIVFLLFCINI